MTMVPAKVIIENLRADKKKLEDQIEAIKKFLKETIEDEVFSEWQTTEYAKEALKILENKK